MPATNKAKTPIRKSTASKMSQKISKPLTGIIEKTQLTAEENFSQEQTPPYTPHAKQLKFHTDPSRNRWIFGGNRTGKTMCGAQEAVWRATGTHPHQPNRADTIGWVVSLSTQVQRDVTQKKILESINADDIVEIVMLRGRKDSPKGGVIDFIKLRNNWDGESIIAFKSCEQGREKFQGTSLDWVWFDEEPPEDVYDECVLRTMDRAGHIWGTMTPLKGRTWVYEKVFLHDGDEISVHSMSWEDNPYLADAEIKKMTRRLSHDQLESRKFGRFMEGTGLVFKEFGDENIIEFLDPKIRASLEITISIDPGYVNPTGILWIGRTSGGDTYVLKDHAPTEQNVELLCNYIHAQSKVLNVDVNAVRIIMDSAAVQKTLGSPESVASKFRKRGINCDTNVNKSIPEGIMAMKTLFKNAEGVRQLFIMKGCTNLIRELRSYYWGDEERPVKKNDHCIDALRYYVAMWLEKPYKQKTRMTYAQKFKNNLLKGIK